MISRSDMLSRVRNVLSLDLSYIGYGGSPANRQLLLNFIVFCAYKESRSYERFTQIDPDYWAVGADKLAKNAVKGTYAFGLFGMLWATLHDSSEYLLTRLKRKMLSPIEQISYKEAQTLWEIVRKGRKAMVSAVKTGTFPKLSVETQVLLLLSAISRYEKFYIKKALNDINTEGFPSLVRIYTYWHLGLNPYASGASGTEVRNIARHHYEGFKVWINLK